MQILVIDDRKNDRESMVDLLTTFGYATTGAASGPEALRYLAQNSIDLVLLDIVMPGMDGIEVLKQLKTCRPDLDVILITAYATLEKAVAGLKEGAYDFLAKPCTAEALIAAVERVREKKALQEDIRNSEERLRQSERFLHSVLESLGDAVVVIDREMRIISANQGYRRQTKMVDEEILGRHCYQVSHGFSRPCYLEEDDCDCAVTMTFKDGQPHTAIHTHRDKLGQPLYVETNSYPLRDENDFVYAVVETIHDITHLKKLEEEKKSIEAQLIQAQKMEAVGQLAGGIAHDFNNTLTAILGFGGLIKMKMAPDDPNLPYLEDILKAGHNAAQLIQGLLAFSRKQLIRPELLDLAELLQKTRKMMERTLREDIELKIIPSAEPLPIMADSSQLQQVILNLVGNARDSMPDGGELVIESGRMLIDASYIKHHGYGQKGEYVWLALTDSGTGMDERTRKKIFEPFFSTKEQGKGTGLGLAMVYGIIKQHQGYINVYSEPGQGSSFRVYLPAFKTKTDQGQQPAPEPEREEASPGGKEIILLADDDPAVSRVACAILEGAGYTVLSAADGDEALALFTANRDRIDLAILDVIMPKKDGKAVYDLMLRDKPGTRVLFFSGYTANTIHNKGVLADTVNLLLKPVSPAELLKKVREVLDDEASA